MSDEENAKRDVLILSNEHGLVTQSSKLTKRVLRLAQAVYSKPDVEKAFAGETARAIQIALDRPKYWEHLLTAELLRSKIAKSRSEFANWQKGTFLVVPIEVSGHEFIKCSRSVSETFVSEMRQLPMLVKELPSSWGSPGEPGDPLKIKDAIDKIIFCCNNSVHSLIELESKIPPEPFRRIKDLHIAFLADFANEYFVKFGQLAQEIEQPVKLVNGVRKIRLSLNISNETMQAYETEANRLNQMILARQIDPFNKPTNV